MIHIRTTLTVIFQTHDEKHFFISVLFNPVLTFPRELEIIVK